LGEPFERSITLQFITMAKHPVLFFSGKMGPVVSVKRYDKYYLRRLPETVRQTASTKLCSSNFALASGAGKNLRRLLVPVTTPFDKISSMQARFMGAFMSWLQSKDLHSIQPVIDIPTVNNFQFNNTKGVVNRWQQSLTVAEAGPGRVQVHLPAFVPTRDLRAPGNTVAVSCVIVTACCKLLANKPLANTRADLFFTYNDALIPAQSVFLDAVGDKDTLVITAVTVRYKLANGRVCDKPVFMPSGVIGAMYR
jgi:hypothetical protein